MYFFLIISIGMSALPIAASPAPLLRQIKQESAEIRSRRLPELQNEFESTEDLRRKLIAAMALGINYMEIGAKKAALTYLRASMVLLPPKDPLYHLALLNFAKLSLDLGQVADAMQQSWKVYQESKNREQKREAFDTYIASASAAGQLEKIKQVYLTEAKRIGLAKISHATLILFSKAWKASNHTVIETEILEVLAEQYPLTPQAMEGFHRLLDYHLQQPSRYVFSTRLLQKMAINRNLDFGIEEFLVTQSRAPLRINRDQPRQLTDLERMALLLDLNLLNAIDREITIVDTAMQAQDVDTRRSAVLLKAKLRFDQRNYEEAIDLYQQSMLLKLDSRDRFRVEEALAQSHFALGQYQKSAEIYEKLVSIESQKQYGWEWFWSLYRSQQFSTALDVLSRKNLVKLKDPGEPLAFEYWRGRILEKMGRQDEADQEYRSILQRDATSYYANLVLAQKEHFWKEMVAQPRQDPGTKTASLEPVPIAPTEDHELNILQELVSAGLYNDAITFLQEIDTKRLKGQSDLALMENLAYYLGDYRSYRKIVLQNFAEFQSFPKNLHGLVNHVQDHILRWQAVFPLAYDKTMTRLSEVVPIDKHLLLSVMRTESRYDVLARSHVGARGLLQIMPKTALKISELIGYSEFKVQDLYDPPINIGYGGYYLDRLLKYYSGNTYLAVAGYNAGPIATNRWLLNCKSCETDELVESITYRETRRYVKEVMKYYGIYNKVYRIDQPTYSLPKIPVSVDTSAELF